MQRQATTPCYHACSSTNTTKLVSRAVSRAVADSYCISGSREIFKAGLSPTDSANDSEKLAFPLTMLGEAHPIE